MGGALHASLHDHPAARLRHLRVRLPRREHRGVAGSQHRAHVPARGRGAQGERAADSASSESQHGGLRCAGPVTDGPRRQFVQVNRQANSRAGRANHRPGDVTMTGMFQRPGPRLSVLPLVALLLAGPGAAFARAQAPGSPCAIETTERVVAVGDVHGAYDRFTGILRAAGLIDQRDRWIGGRAILIQTGDIVDRGAHSKRVIDLLRRLERDAARAGGHVYPLLGNHEFMRAAHDWRYVSADEYEAFENNDSESLQKTMLERMLVTARRRATAEGRDFDADEYREQFFKDIPPGYLEMRRAFDKGGQYGDWVRKRLAAVKVNGVLFVHAGISEKTAALGCDGINAAIRADLEALPVPMEKVPGMFASSEDGPLWYRGLALEPEEALAPAVD